MEVGLSSVVAPPRAWLEAHKIRITEQRLRIAELLLVGEQHVSADALVRRLASRGEGIARATVYNTLNLFADEGLVRRVFVDRERVYFDTRVAPHAHFYNVDTGELTDIAPGGLRCWRLADLPAGTSELDIDIVVRLQNARSGRS
ncbi:MAG: Fur family transcriptional regulator [Pseudomonadota bacterium]